MFIGNSATSLGYVMFARGDLNRARPFLGQGLEVLGKLGNPAWTASALSLGPRSPLPKEMIRPPLA